MTQPPPQEHDKRHRIRDEEESRSQKMERHEFEAARRASLVDEKALQLRAIEFDAGVSRSKAYEA